jgi:hypothetical protein
VLKYDIKNSINKIVKAQKDFLPKKGLSSNGDIIYRFKYYGDTSTLVSEIVNQRNLLDKQNIYLEVVNQYDELRRVI